MGLRETAEADLSLILEDDISGFGWPITLTAPDGIAANLVGFSNDISQSIDPDTGLLVTGRVASVVLRMSTVKNLGFDLPKGIVDTSKKPWIVDFNDINNKVYKFKISSVNPDYSLGIVVCFLEVYTI